MYSPRLHVLAATNWSNIKGNMNFRHQACVCVLMWSVSQIFTTTVDQILLPVCDVWCCLCEKRSCPGNIQSKTKLFPPSSQKYNLDYFILHISLSNHSHCINSKAKPLFSGKHYLDLDTVEYVTPYMINNKANASGNNSKIKL